MWAGRLEKVEAAAARKLEALRGEMDAKARLIQERLAVITRTEEEREARRADAYRRQVRVGTYRWHWCVSVHQLGWVAPMASPFCEVRVRMDACAAARCLNYAQKHVRYVAQPTTSTLVHCNAHPSTFDAPSMR